MGLIDLDLREKAVLVAFLVPIVWIGVNPDPVLRRLDSAVIDLLQTMESRSEAVLVAPVGDPALEITR